MFPGFFSAWLPHLAIGHPSPANLMLQQKPGQSRYNPGFFEHLPERGLLTRLAGFKLSTGQTPNPLKRRPAAFDEQNGIAIENNHARAVGSLSHARPSGNGLPMAQCERRIPNWNKPFMCSRYSLTSPPEAVRATFGYVNDAEFPPRYNIAPTEPVAIVRIAHSGVRELALVRWGLIPSWVKDPTKISTLINARSETAAVKPSFRGSMRHRRCIIPADAFYEWTGKSGSKQPHMITFKSGQMLGFAGLWDHWLGPDGSEIETMAILTTASNAEMTKIHDRMPVILAPTDYEAWLDCSAGSSVGIDRFLKPAPDNSLEIIAISKELNNPRNDRPEVQQPLQGKLF